MLEVGMESQTILSAIPLFFISANSISKLITNTDFGKKNQKTNDTLI